MKKIHVVVPSLFLGLATLFAVQSAAGILPLGLLNTADKKPAKLAQTSDDQIARQEAALAQAEANLRAAANRKVPKLPTLPTARATGAQVVYASSSGNSGASGSSSGPSSNSGPGSNSNRSDGEAGEDSDDESDHESEHENEHNVASETESHGDDD